MTHQVDLYSAEFGDDLTGYEEKEIVKAFGRSIDQLGEAGYEGIRALIFAHRMREGDTAKVAKDAAMKLKRHEVIDYFEGLGNRPVESDETEGKE